ncbi:Uncharacterised protein [Bordetella pertussis]|nr:Uncharacterised protein [Bordetella pertussis]
MSSALRDLSATKAALTLVVTVASEAYSPTDCLGLSSPAAWASEPMAAVAPMRVATNSLRTCMVILLYR